MSLCCKCGGTLMSYIASLMSYVASLMSYVATLMSYVAVVEKKLPICSTMMACCVIKKSSHLSWSEKGFSSTVASTSSFCILCYNFITCVHQYPLFCILCYHFIICVYHFLFVFQNLVHFTTIPPFCLEADHYKF